MKPVRLFYVKVGSLYCTAGKLRNGAPFDYKNPKAAYEPKLSTAPKVWSGTGPFKNYLNSVTLPPEAEVMELSTISGKPVDKEEFARYL